MNVDYYSQFYKLLPRRYAPLWLKYKSPKQSFINTIESAYIPVGLAYKMLENFDGERIPQLTSESFGFEFAGKDDKLGAREGTHIGISGMTGSGKTTLEEKIMLHGMRRRNDKLGVVISTKEDMDMEWETFRLKCKEIHVNCEYLTFDEDDIRIHMQYLPHYGMRTIKNLGLMNKSNEREFMMIFAKSGQRDLIKTFQILEDMRYASQMDGRKVQRWIEMLLMQIETSPFLTYNKHDAFAFKPNTLYLLDFSKIPDVASRDMCIGSICRMIREAVAGKPNYQAFVCIDEYFSTVMDVPSGADTGIMDDAYREIRNMAVGGRQQGISLILAYQTRYNVRKIIGPLTQVDYFFQLKPSNMESDGEFFVKNIVGHKINIIDLEDFFHNLQNVVGACIFYNRKLGSKPPIFGQVEPSLDISA